MLYAVALMLALVTVVPASPIADAHPAANDTSLLGDFMFLRQDKRR